MKTCLFQFRLSAGFGRAADCRPHRARRGACQPSAQRAGASPNGLLGAALTDLNPELASALDSAPQSAPDALEISLNEQPVLVTHASLPDLGWTLSIVIPLADVTAESQNVARSIEADAVATVRNTLLIIFGIVALYFISAELTKRWFYANVQTD